MNAVGIDVSKGKSTVAVIRPFGEVVLAPFEVQHTKVGLKDLVAKIKKIPGETRVVMECTGIYYHTIANYLYDEGIYVSVVNPILVHDYNGNLTLRRGKTDKKDALKLANFALDRWLDLPRFMPVDKIRLMLKMYSRQYDSYIKQKTALKNNLISLLDQTFPCVNKKLFTSSAREDGHQKWVDFAKTFWHCECVSKVSKNAFKNQYKKWCKNNGYNYKESKAEEIYTLACEQVSVLPKEDFTKLLIKKAISQLNTLAETAAALIIEMQRLAAMLPEYSIVMSIHGVGDNLGPRLIAEIGDVRRFRNKKSLVAYAGIDAPPNQSGKFDAQSTRISKRGSSPLRKILFQVMSCVLQKSNKDEPVYQFLNKKRSEGKAYKVYMMAAANKFLRIYYARIKEYLNKLEAAA